MHTEHVAVAIRDALNMLDGIENEEGELVPFDAIDEFSDVFITLETGEQFKVVVIRQG